MIDGERDYVVLALLYDTGARIQELLDLRPTDFRFDSPAFVKITGKGRRERLCPLLPQTARLVASFLSEQRRLRKYKDTLFMNHCGQKLSRHGVRYILKKYLSGAQQKIPALGRCGISPHTTTACKGYALAPVGITPYHLSRISLGMQMLSQPRSMCKSILK